MHKVFILFIVFGSFTLTGVSQSIIVEGKILAFDSFGSLLRVSSVPPTQIFIMRSVRVLKGKEVSRTLIIRQENFDERSALLTLIPDGGVSFIMKLTRQRACDSSFDALDVVYLNDRSQAAKPVSRIIPVKEPLVIPRQSVLPCYVLNNREYILDK